MNETIMGNIRNQTPIILAIDTTQSALCLALTCGKDVLADVSDDSGLPHSQRLFPLFDEVLKSSSLTIADIDLLAVNTGPGSFTGLRVGIAAVKGLATTLGTKAIGVNAFDALASASGLIGVPIITVINASKGEFYCGWRQVEETGAIRSLQEDDVMNKEQLKEQLNQTVFMVSLNDDSVSALIAHPEKIRFVQDSLAPVIASIALSQWKSGQALILEPYYLRPSAAESKLGK